MIRSHAILKIPKVPVLQVGLILVLAGLLASCSSPSDAEIAFEAHQTAVLLVQTYAAQATSTPIPTPFLSPTPAVSILSTPSPHQPSPSPTPLPKAARQSIRIAAELPTDLHPHTMQGLNRLIANALFPTLIRVDGTNLESLPAMAESWQVSEDGLTCTFILRNDIPWVSFNPNTQQVEVVSDSTGNPRMVTAADFAAGLQQFFNAYQGGEYRFLRQLVNSSSPVKVTAVNERILAVEFAQAYPWLELFFALPISAAIPAWDALNPQEMPLSYGPLAVKGWYPNNSLFLVANPFWSGIPAIPASTLQEIELLNIFIDDPIQAYKNQHATVAWLNIQQAQKAAGQADLSAQMITRPGNCLTYLGYDTGSKPFHHPLVRLAFSLGIDRQQALSDAGQNQLSPASFFPEWARSAPQDHLFPADDLPYRPEQARAILDSVYPDRTLIPEITLVSANDLWSKNIAASLARQWEQNLGIQIKRKTVDAANLPAVLSSTPAPQLRIGKFCPSIPHAIYLFQSWQMDPAQNISNWTDDSYTQLLQTAIRQNDPLRRMETLLLLQDHLIRQESVLLPLAWEQQVTLSQPSLLRQDAKAAWMEQLEEWVLLKP